MRVTGYKPKGDSVPFLKIDLEIPTSNNNYLILSATSEYNGEGRSCARTFINQKKVSQRSPFYNRRMSAYAEFQKKLRSLTKQWIYT